MATDKERWDGFIKQNPKIKLEIQEKYLLNNREVVSSNYLQSIWGVTDKTIRNYISQGMPVLEQSSAKFKIFDLIECVTWRLSQIDMSKSNVSKTQQKESDAEQTEQAVFEANRRKTIADAKKAEHEANIAEIKEKSTKGEYVDAVHADRDKATQALIHISELYNDKKILPTMLEEKTRERISELLEKHYKGRVDNLREILLKEYECDETLYEIVQEVLEQLKNQEPKEIINKIRRK